MDSWFWAAAVIAVLITGISKSGLGGGIGGVAVPVLALTIAPAQAAAIMLPILCFMDLLSVRAYRGRWHRGHVLRLVPAAKLIAGRTIAKLPSGTHFPSCSA